MLDYYRILNISQFATDDEIRKAYKKQSLKLHPDKCPFDPNATRHFQLLAEAYEVLSDPDKRQQYDWLISPIIPSFYFRDILCCSGSLRTFCT